MVIDFGRRRPHAAAIPSTGPSSRSPPSARCFFRSGGNSSLRLSLLFFFLFCCGGNSFRRHFCRRSLLLFFRLVELGGCSAIQIKNTVSQRSKFREQISNCLQTIFLSRTEKFLADLVQIFTESIIDDLFKLLKISTKKCYRLG